MATAFQFDAFQNNAFQVGGVTGYIYAVDQDDTASIIGAVGGVDTHDGFTKEELLESVPTARTVPQIFLDGKYVGGFDDLRQHFQNTVV